MIADLAMQNAPLTPDDIVREVRHLPSAPKVLPRLKALLLDGNSAVHQIVALIRLDPGIAARVLQAANSAYHSTGVRCYTVEEAVSRVGYAEVYELVALAVASQVLVRPLDVYGVEADQLWKLSVTCALAAEALAVQTGQDRDVAYTIGLLHAVGMVAIDEWALHQARPIKFKNTGFPREAVDSERAIFGFTQAEAGAALLRHWDFPASMVEPVRWQYAPMSSGSRVRITCLLSAAKWLRSTVCAPNGEKVAPPEASHLQVLGLTPATLKAMVPEIASQLTAVSTLLEDGRADFDARQLGFPAQTWVAGS